MKFGEMKRNRGQPRQRFTLSESSFLVNLFLCDPKLNQREIDAKTYSLSPKPLRSMTLI